MQMICFVATAPNQYWHANTTYYSILGTWKVCITIVMDKYSKMILGFAAGEKLCFSVIKEGFTEALHCEIKYKPEGNSYFVTDGGQEDNNQQVHGFLRSLTGTKQGRGLVLN